ncbi:CGNR zinc finger domain-containing protein [Streptomyces sp. MK5]|uniref:CGNR zinc finger domain-containing protein n=1 Tax=Streptomyces sp. MK5 TaxID=3064253 RepID=UPI002740BFF7|nr:CGNR zinc finger domain-containing protein [Streptomyces sp. MK5]
MDHSLTEAAATRVTAGIRALRFDAGSLALNLVATVGRRPVVPVERLDGVDRLRRWCAGVGFRLREADATPETVQSLHALRDAAYDIAAAVLRDGRPRRSSVDLVNRCAQAAPPAPRLRLSVAGVALDERSVELSADALLSLIARDLITLVGDPVRRSRLSECDSETCRMIYLTSGSGRPRRWCSMQRCGNSAKAARHRHRKTVALSETEEPSA